MDRPWPVIKSRGKKATEKVTGKSHRKLPKKHKKKSQLGFASDMFGIIEEFYLSFN